MSDKPMTAEEIHKRTGEQLAAGNGIEDDVIAIGNGLLLALLNLDIREREHAELLARVERLEKGADDGR